MKSPRIVVLDSAVDCEHVFLKDIDFEIYQYDGSNWIINKCSSKPNTGHGTAVCGILAKNTDCKKITLFDILDETLKTNINQLVSALVYIDNNIDCEIINMSLGTRLICKELYDICYKLYKKGVILISAFDNSGAVSFPAAYPFVIGVDSSARCTHYNDFVFVENSIVNIRGKGGNQRVAWVNPEFTINQGSSFAAPYVTAQVYKYILNEIEQQNVILESFKKEARYIYYNESSKWLFDEDLTIQDEELVINNAGVYPFNKEVHSLLNFKDQLIFNLVAIYDHKYSGRIKLNVNSINNEFHYQIQNVESIEWDSIDTMIIGHLSEMDVFTKKDLKKDILQQCLNHNKNVYCFDNYQIDNNIVEQFKNKKLKIKYPCQGVENLHFNKFDKLYQIKSPVLGVFGTTRQQGKFTLQLQLRKQFKKHDYTVSQLGTEPSASLFGMNEVFPFGYNSTINNMQVNTIEFVNYQMHKLDQREPDIIIAGSQSGTIPMMYYNLGQIPLQAYEFLLGVRPDGVILCVNLEDSMFYIKRTINAIEALACCKVIAIGIYPLYHKNGWNILNKEKVIAPQERISEFKSQIFESTSLKSYVIGLELDKEKLFNTCLEFFS